MGAEIQIDAAPQLNRRQRSKATTRQKVLDAAQALFEAKAETGEDSYVKATIRDIANLAGMSTGAVFANFKGKADLYRAIYGHLPVSTELGRQLLHVLRDARKLIDDELWVIPSSEIETLMARIDAVLPVQKSEAA